MFNAIWWKLYSIKRFIKSYFGYSTDYDINPYKHAWFMQKNKHLVKKTVSSKDLENDLENL